MTTPTPREQELADHELLMAAPCNGAGFRHPFATVAQADAELSVYGWQLRQRGAYSPTLMGERAAELASLLPKTEAARLLDQYALVTLAQAERGIPATELLDVCSTCGGRGVVGGFVAADSGYQDDPCPECQSY